LEPFVRRSIRQEIFDRYVQMKKDTPGATDREIEKFRAAVDELHCEWNEDVMRNVLRNLVTPRPTVEQLPHDNRAVIGALRKTETPFVLEEVAATASVSFEAAWYAVLELIELGLVTVTGIGLYQLSVQGRQTTRQLFAAPLRR
jgi:hypothetical protein